LDLFLSIEQRDAPHLAQVKSHQVGVRVLQGDGGLAIPSRCVGLFVELRYPGLFGILVFLLAKLFFL
jgi:hypothetical protein